MTIDSTITLGQLLATAVTFFVALIAAAWALLTLAGRQTAARVTDQIGAVSGKVDGLRTELTAHKTYIDTSLAALSSQTRTVERDLLQLKADLPNHYERRDDAIRREVTIISRLDRINERLRGQEG